MRLTRCNKSGNETDNEAMRLTRHIAPDRTFGDVHSHTLPFPNTFTGSDHLPRPARDSAQLYCNT